jgi:hypothetical protein
MAARPSLPQGIEKSTPRNGERAPRIGGWRALRIDGRTPPLAGGVIRIAERTPAIVRRWTLMRAAAAFLVLASAIRAQTALEPADAGADFKIQGEYSGKIETVTPMGVQVVALGDGQFKAVFLPGGLPGQGWNGKDRIEAPGSLQAGTATFSGGGYSATIASEGASITGTTDKGALFTFNKAERKSPTEGAPAPSGAIVLFDGTGVAAWKDGTASMDLRKLFRPEGVTASAGAITRQSFQDFTLHLEFREPFMPAARGTQRGNSGVYLQGRYELQVLDSFGANLATGADTMAPKRECGAFWEHVGPSLNMAYPPLSWQTYDIAFTAARFDNAGKRTSKAVITVRWNGEVVHDKWNMADRTLAGDPEGPAAGPLRFQGYGDPVFYRNIWLVEGAAPVKPRVRKSTGRAVRGEDGGSFVMTRADGKSVSDSRARPASGFYFLSGPEGIRGEYVLKERDP